MALKHHRRAAWGRPHPPVEATRRQRPVRQARGWAGKRVPDTGNRRKRRGAERLQGARAHTLNDALTAAGARGGAVGCSGSLGVGPKKNGGRAEDATTREAFGCVLDLGTRPILQGLGAPLSLCSFAFLLLPSPGEGRGVFTCNTPVVEPPPC